MLANCVAVDTIKGADVMCPTNPESHEIVPGKDVFINALAETLPDCDRKNDMATLVDLESQSDKKERCYVYCAKSTCDAAKTFMATHAERLGDACEKVIYLPGGATEMEANDLVGGGKCHASITKSNDDAPCLTCKTPDISVNVEIDGKQTVQSFSETQKEIPEWFRREGIVSRLPPMFTCDARYKAIPPNSPTPFGPPKPSRIRMSIHGGPFAPDATLAYWAANPSDDILHAEDAYGKKWANSGIVKCKENVCEFDMHMPGRYTAEGKTYDEHLHLAEWQKDRWSLDTFTVSLDKA